MDSEQITRVKLWEIRSKKTSEESQLPAEFAPIDDTLELWHRDDGTFAFHAINSVPGSAMSFVIQHPDQIHDLIKACVGIMHCLAHVPARMPEQLQPTTEIVATFFNGYQVQCAAADVEDWGIIKNVLILETQEEIYLGDRV